MNKGRISSYAYTKRDNELTMRVGRENVSQIDAVVGFRCKERSVASWEVSREVFIGGTGGKVRHVPRAEVNHEGGRLLHLSDCLGVFHRSLWRRDIEEENGKQKLFRRR